MKDRWQVTKATGPENIGPERALPGLLAVRPVLSPSRITLENNGKIRPQPGRENDSNRLGGGGDGSDIQPSPGFTRVAMTAKTAPRDIASVCKLRCAVYTRKSSEEGLEQEFNSLHAQREACEAYIASQRSEGWVLVRDQYDDGGISGGTLERPGLKRLMADIEDGLVDVVVVYKIDRLSRSLADFAKLVEVFDRNGVTFVSVILAAAMREAVDAHELLGNLRAADPPLRHR